MKNKKENLNGMKKEDLLKQLAVVEENIRLIKFKAEGSRSKNVKELANFKKEIARILTALSNKK
jgi:ribosomal protein L29